MAAGSEPDTFLALLSDTDRAALLGRGGGRGFARGEHLMHQGEPGDGVLLLTEGHAKATFVDSRGQEIVLSFRGPGDVLGELSFMQSALRSNGVVAIEPVQARALAASEFRAFLLERPSASLTLIEVIGRRFRDANRARISFGESDTAGRVAARLIELCERYGERIGSEIEIGLPLTQDDLAGWTASSRAGVGEALALMRGRGWVRTGRRRITVLDPEALGALAS